LSTTKTRAELQHVVGVPRRMAFHFVLPLSVLLALGAMAAWLGLSFALTGVDPARYREVAADAARSGTVAQVFRLPLAPDKEFYPHGGDDCLTLAMLIAPRETRLKSAVSPRVPVGEFRVDAAVRAWFPPHAFCDALAAMLQAEGALGASRGPLPELIYYHRYIHGTVTTAALLLSVMSFEHATMLMLATCYALLAWLIVAAAACLIVKQLIVLAIWGPETLADFAGRLGQRTGGGVTEELSQSVRDRLDEVGLSLAWLDASFASRIVFAGIMLVYSAFIIGWGSHVLGTAILLLPVPLLMLSAYGAARRSGFQAWPLEHLALLGAAMIPFVWDLAFLNHTILHSSFMVRPAALSAGLVAVAWIYAHDPGAKTPVRSR
jgi:hypothetical protein